MVSDQEWEPIAKRVFPPKDVKAPAYLWTRVLAGIEAREQELMGRWWLQWRWMSRVAMVATLLFGIASALLWRQADAPIEMALDGETPQLEAIQLASARMSTPDESAGLILEEASWAQN